MDGLLDQLSSTLCGLRQIECVRALKCIEQANSTVCMCVRVSACVYVLTYVCVCVYMRVPT